MDSKLIITPATHTSCTHSINTMSLHTVPPNKTEMNINKKRLRSNATFFVILVTSLNFCICNN